MKLLKKISTCISVSFITIGIFAQNPDYQAHLAKGKEYEEQKKWVNALGEYYDAMTVELSESTIGDFDAYNSWLNIADKINNGNPGLGEYDDFDYVDSWILLLQEYEKYWTENCPKIIYFNKPMRTELNRERKTADYSIKIDFIDNLKFQEIDKLIQKGFKKAYKDEWNLDYLRDWPKVSVYSDKKYDGNYLINGTALTSYLTITDRMHPDGGSTTYISEELLAKTHSKSIQKIEPTQRYNAALTSIQEWQYLDANHPQRQVFNYDYDGSSGVSLYDIKFSILDKTNRNLLQSSRYNVGLRDSSYCTHIYEFKNVPQETMKLIESGEVNCIIDELYLNYGKIDKLVMANDRSYLKNLPDLKIEHFSYKTWLDDNSPYKYDGSVKYYDSNSNKSSVEEIKKVKEEQDYIEKQQAAKEERLKRDAEETAQKEKEEMQQAFEAFDRQITSNTEILMQFPIIEIKKEKKNPQYFVQNYNKVYYGIGGDYSKLNKQYDSENLDTVLGYLSCNLKSIEENLRPYYEVEGASISNYNSEAELFLENFDKITGNSSSNGWHFPSKNEIEYVWKKRKAEENKSNIGSFVGIGGTSSKSSLLMISDNAIQDRNLIIRVEQ